MISNSPSCIVKLSQVSGINRKSCEFCLRLLFTRAAQLGKRNAEITELQGRQQAELFHDPDVVAGEFDPIGGAAAVVELEKPPYAGSAAR